VEARESRRLPLADAPKERLKGFIEPGEHILQDVAVHRGVLRHRGAEALQLRFLGIA